MSYQTAYLITWIVCILAAIVFSFVLFFGAPFLPTQKRRVAEALDLLDLKAGQTFVELGSGDGRILRAAAQRGIRGIGYELNPVLVWWSRFRCRRYRHLVTVHNANYWHIPLPPADGIYVFLLQPYMARLHRKILAEARKPLRLVSLSFSIPQKRPVAKRGEFFLYIYKA